MIPTYTILKIINYDDAFLLSLYTGFAFYSILFIFLIIYERYMNKKYKKAETLITSKILYKINGNLSIGKSVKNANIYLTDDRIVFISLDEKPYAMEEVLLRDIEKYEASSSVSLNIHTKDNRLFVIKSAEVKDFILLLKEYGWLR